jgi:hypothetical protein
MKSGVCREQHIQEVPNQKHDGEREHEAPMSSLKAAEVVGLRHLLVVADGVRHESDLLVVGRPTATRPCGRHPETARDPVRITKR